MRFQEYDVRNLAEKNVTRLALGYCSNNQMRIFQTARSRLYRGRFLQPNTHFFSIFQDLQDRHTFAPLQIQKLQIFCENLQNFGNFLIFFANVAEIVWNRWFFVEIFAEFCRNCGKSQIIHHNFQKSAKFSEICKI